MIIADFTEPELDYFRKNCNFVGYEREVFESRCRGVPLERIAEAIGLSYDYTRRISCKVNRKIIRSL